MNPTVKPNSLTISSRQDLQEWKWDYTEDQNFDSAGVPQASALSPTLYTADLPQTAVNCINMQYADDVTQIIKYPGKSRQLVANKTVQGIEGKKYEKQR